MTTAAKPQLTRLPVGYLVHAADGTLLGKVAPWRGLWVAQRPAGEGRFDTIAKHLTRNEAVAALSQAAR